MTTTSVKVEMLVVLLSFFLGGVWAGVEGGRIGGVGGEEG